MPTISVEGMSCGGCEEAVEAALKKVNGVTSATADREAETATVDGTTDVETLVAAVEEAGYSAQT